MSQMPDDVAERSQMLGGGVACRRVGSDAVAGSYEILGKWMAAGSGVPDLKRGRPPARRYGEWLREQRLMRCWSAGEMARRLREAAASAGYKLPDKRCLVVMIYRWEDDRSGISARYRTLYCRALGIPFSEFGKPVDQPPVAAVPLLSDVLTDVAQMLAEAAVKLLGALEACGVTPGTVTESARRTSALADRVPAPRRAS